MEKRLGGLPYQAPILEVLIIELEQGIAAASATITPGGPGANNFNPEVEDWQDSGAQNGNFDL